MDNLKTATDRVIFSLGGAEADLKAVAHRLEEEFHERYAGKGANPLSILHRLNHLQRELPDVRKECCAVEQARRDLLSRAKQQLSANMELLQHLQARAGLPQTAVGDGSAYGLFMTGAK